MQVQLDQKGVSLEVSQEARNGWPRKVTTGQWAHVRWRVSSGQPEKTARQRTAVWFAGGRRQVTVALDKEKNELTYGFQSHKSTRRKQRINLIVR